MKKWIIQKIKEWTSRKFIGFIMVEAAVIYLVAGGYIADAWAAIAGIIIPFVLYEFVNGALHLQSLRINLPQVQISGDTADAVGEDVAHTNEALADPNDPDSDDVIEVPNKKINEMGFHK